MTQTPTTQTTNENYTKEELVTMAQKKKGDKNDDLDLLERRKQHHEKQKMLEDEKKECNERLQALQAKRAYLEEEKSKFKQQQAEYSAITAQRSKLAQESEKTKGEITRSQRKQKEAEIKTKTAELHHLTLERDALAAGVERYKAYKDFLEQVEEKSSEASTIDEIMNRFTTLTRTYLSIREEIEQQRQQKDDIQDKHQEFVKDNHVIYMQLSSQMEQKQNELKDLRMELKKKEGLLYSLDDQAVLQKEIKAQLSMAIRNLYQQLKISMGQIFRPRKAALAQTEKVVNQTVQSGDKTTGSTSIAAQIRKDKAASTQGGSSDSMNEPGLTLEVMLHDLQLQMEDMQFIIERWNAADTDAKGSGKKGLDSTDN
ncbi:MAG: hypothetical protein EZS28_005828 [Streblomastix strix]|uniref:DUF4200 domain-containing protein n=1 Tax=Streblomastix strix TaxID=222440 RepID=A0A5J4WUQ4_9EUKA|nr:MAG: hypothetical protein EZS28_005828 [Streblomastix strix]